MRNDKSPTMTAPVLVFLVLNRCVIGFLRLQQWLIYPKSRLVSGEGFLQNLALKGARHVPWRRGLCGFRRSWFDSAESAVPFVDSWQGASYNPRRQAVWNAASSVLTIRNHP